jgi:hypothetical protein
MKSKILVFIILPIFFSISTISVGEILFKDNFEDDVIDKPPRKWMIGFQGKDDSKVIWDPKLVKNKVFSSPTARHDVKGAVYITGQGKDWTDYYVQWDMLYPIDFYMGIVFRFTGGESFYLLDRRQPTKTLQFWKRQGGWKSFGSSEALGLGIEKWWSFQLKVSGNDFEVKMKDSKKKTKFANLKPVLEGSNGEFKKGDFGNYGHVLLDNVVVATKLSDFSNPWDVSPENSIVTTWSHIKQRHRN